MSVFWRDSGQKPDSDRGKEPRKGGAPPPRRPQGPLPGGRPFRTLAFWAFVALLSLAAFRMYQGTFMAPQRVEVSYTRFISEVDKGNIGNLQIVEKGVTGELKNESVTRISGHDVPFKMFRTNIVGSGEDLPDRVWRTNPGIEVEVRAPGFNWVNILFSWLPLLLLLVFWLLMLRQVQSGGSAALKFGKTKARVMLETQTKVTFKDVAGADEAKSELQEIIEFLKEPQKFQRLGGRIPKGALLLGPPGSGKTLLAKAVAGEAGVPFFSMSGSDFVEMFVGVGASVTPDTPVLIRENGRTRLQPIGEFVDRHYEGDAEGFVVPVRGVETLGFAEKSSKFTGSSKKFFGGSTWSGVQGVYRHRTTEICEIEYLGGVIRTTPDHSVFVRSRNGVKAVAASDLMAGDVLVAPGLDEVRELIGSEELVHAGSAVEEAGHFPSNALPQEGSTLLDPSTAAWACGHGDQVPVVRRVTRKPYDGYVYDLCGCDQEAFFGGDKPVLLHNSRVRDLFEQGKRNAPCLTGDAVVTLSGGRQVTIREMFEKRMVDVHVPAMTEDFRLEDARVIGITCKPAPDLFEITTSTSSVKATGNHLFPVLRDDGMKWISASELTSDDYVAMPRAQSETDLAPTVRRTTRSLSEGFVELKRSSTAMTIGEDESLIDLGQSAILWTRIESIRSLPAHEPVYDLCLERHHCFIANNLIVHNCIIFVDEIDAVGRHRGAGLGGGHDEREQTLNQLLVEMDGFDSNEGVIIIAATNRPDVLDPALLRPGRFDRQIVVDWPDVRGREGILKVHTRKVPLADDVDLAVIARGTPGLAGADLANMVNEAALLAARRNHKKVSMRDVEDAKDKVTLGMERKSLVMTQEERRSTAYHEAGHALVAWLMPGSDPVDKVTIIPRGRALGLTSYVPAEERHSRSKEDLIRLLAMMMGGRSAEHLIFNHYTTGAANDIERATSLARRMVCELGMSENLGPLTFGKKEEMVFLGKEISSHKDYSEQTAVQIDQEVRTLVEGAYKQAVGLLSENLDKLHLLANTLLEREVVDGDEMNRVLRGEKLEPLKPVETEPASDSAPESAAAKKDEPAQIDAFGRPPSPRPAGA